jgi:hypothetical protein
MVKRTILAVLTAGSLILAGCGSLGDFFDYGSSSLADSYSVSSEEFLAYYFRNESSYEVTIWDSRGNTATLSANGGSASGMFNRNVSIADVKYTPADRVSAYRSDFTHVTFRDR